MALTDNLNHARFDFVQRLQKPWNQGLNIVQPIASGHKYEYHLRRAVRFCCDGSF